MNIINIRMDYTPREYMLNMDTENDPRYQLKTTATLINESSAGSPTNTQF